MLSIEAFSISSSLSLIKIFFTYLRIFLFLASLFLYYCSLEKSFFLKGYDRIVFADGYFGYPNLQISSCL